MRPDWDQYMLTVAEATALRATCSRRQIGAVIATRDHRIVSTGYNGGPRGMGHCTDGFCPRANGSANTGFGYDDPEDYCIAIHAEANAIMFASPESRGGSTLYSTLAPCFSCAKLISNSGIDEVVVSEVYKEFDRVKDFLKDNGVRVRVMEKV